MRHLNRVKKLNRTKSHRKALLQNLANSLFDHERITTTNPKAMELKKVADRLITLAKRKDMHSMRLAFGFLRDKGIVQKLFSDICERYATVNGGYTRVLKIGNRKGDNAPMAIIELTMKKEKDEEKQKTSEKASKANKPVKESAPKKEKAPKKESKAGKKTKEAAAEALAPKEKKPRKKKEAAPAIEAEKQAEAGAEEQA